MTLRSSLPQASHFPSGLKATEATSSQLSASTCWSAPSATRQRRTVPRRRPRRRLPVICFQSVPSAPFSRPPLASHRPSGLNATE
ncbi:MAG TPA: hypothetical protein VKF32_02150 [Thermoanaerobaculia bacterium]|nr:hypothetical protein [Thermoanaerobaculia bacterium]